MDEWRRKQWERYEVLRYIDDEWRTLEYVRDKTEDFVNAQINEDLLEECKRLGYTINDIDAQPGVGGYHIIRINDKRIGVQCRGKDKCLVCIDGFMRHDDYRASGFDERKERGFESEIVPSGVIDLETINYDKHPSVLWTHFSALAAKNKGKRKSFDEMCDEEEDGAKRRITDRASGSTDTQSGTDPVPVLPKEPGPDPPTSPVQSQQ